jgi:hypothetical protein
MAQGGLPGSKERSGIWNLKNIRNAQNNAEYGQSNLYDIELLLVGGGGAGGGWSGGSAGGGAGGVIYANGLSVRRGCQYGIVIGSGGPNAHQNDTIGSKGANTTFCYTGGAQYPGSDVSIIALGGGGGANGPGLPGGYYGATEGGSGGGSASYQPGSHYAPLFPNGSNACGCPLIGTAQQRRPENWGYLPGIMGFGNDGGFANLQFGRSGGGGGAGSKGGDGTRDGNANGGRGLTFSISGSAVGYAGGGAGGAGGSACIHTGGLGYDGAGNVYDVTPVPGGNPGSFGTSAPIANRGAGAGGVNTFAGPNPSAGATGVAVIKYAGFQRGTGGNSCTTCVGSVAVNTIHTFTGSGTFTA